MKTHILHIIGAMNRGGVETWLMHILRHIDRSRFQVDFLVHTDQPAAYRPASWRLSASGDSPEEHYKRKRTDLYYPDVYYCVRNFTQRVALLHDYEVWDATYIVRSG